MEPVVFFISLFACIFGVSYFYLITRNKERLALIESGADASLFTTPNQKKNIKWGYSIVLIVGFLAMGIGLGVFTGYLLEKQIYLQNLALKGAGDISHAEVSNPKLYIMAIFFFGGLALITSYFTIRKINKEDNKELDVA